MPSSRSIPGSEELNHLYQAIGKAFAQWQFVEAELGELFSVLLRVPMTSTFDARAALFAVDSFYSKMQMVDAVAQHALRGPPLLPDWDAMYRRLDRTRKARNNIAHFAVVVRGDLSSTKHVYFLEPTWFDPGNTSETQASYTFEDVRHLCSQFDQTSRDLGNFRRKVMAAFGPPK